MISRASACDASGPIPIPIPIHDPDPDRDRDRNRQAARSARRDLDLRAPAAAPRVRGVLGDWSLLVEGRR
jgi:hypothetical protein